MAAAPSFTPEALPAVTVPPVAERRLQLGERLQRRVGAGMLVALDRHRLALPAGTSTGTISLCEEARRHRRRRRAAASAARRRPGRRG